MKRAFRPIAGEGLLMSDGALWKQQHRLVQPAFHQRRLAVYGEVMVAEALQLVRCTAMARSATSAWRWRN